MGEFMFGLMLTVLPIGIVLYCSDPRIVDMVVDFLRLWS